LRQSQLPESIYDPVSMKKRTRPTKWT